MVLKRVDRCILLISGSCVMCFVVVWIVLCWLLRFVLSVMIVMVFGCVG